MFIKRRGAATDRFGFNAAGRHPTLHPDHHHAGTDPVKLRRLAPRCPALNSSIPRIRNSCEYGFGIGPPEIESCPYTCASVGPRESPVQPDRKLL